MAKNPLTFKDLGYCEQSGDEEVPRNPTLPFAFFGVPDFCSGDPRWIDPDPSEPHAAGEIWCEALWEAHANLIAKHGFAAGRQLMLQLVADGMGLCPPNPTFVQARDALLLADLANTGGANRAQLWSAFAKRGMGWSAAIQPFEVGGEPIEVFLDTTEAFDVPPSGA
jgi:hypothetical protein